MDAPRPRPTFDRLQSEPSAVDWQSVGLKRTPQREVVLALVRSCFDHPTAEWIHQQSRLKIPEISLATIYRTLRILKEKGLIHEFSGGASPSRYDGTLHHHEHVRCIRCGAVQDVELPELGDVRERVAERTKFQVGSYPLVFHGLCEKCSNGNGHAGKVSETPARSRETAGNEGAPRTDDDERDSDRQLAEGFW
jgi:Fe2+ or Zn2+ uptake regulation protein